MSNLVYPAIRGLGFNVLRTPEFPVLTQGSASLAETTVQQAQNPFWHWELLYDFLTDDPRRPTAGLSYTDLRALVGFYNARGASADSFLFLDPDFNAVGPAVITAAWQPFFPYMTGAIIIDPGGHAQQVTVAPQGATSGRGPGPAWNDAGGTTTEGPGANFGAGPITWQDLGSFPGGYPNPQAALQVVTDGAGNYYSPIQQGYGGFLEDVTDLNPQWLGSYVPAVNPIAVYNNGALMVGPLGGGPCGGGIDYQLLSPNNGDPFLAVPGASFAGAYLKWCAGNPGAGPITAQFSYYFRVRFESTKTEFEKFANYWWTAGGEEQATKSQAIMLKTARLPGA